MKNVLPFLKPISWASLLLIIIPPLMHFSGNMEVGLMGSLLMTGTVIWFVSASLWMKGE